jgi:hypothetical protein
MEPTLSLTIKRRSAAKGKILNFLVDPKDFEIRQRHLYEINKVLGHVVPLVGFVSGDVSEISLKATFHEDLGEDYFPFKVDEFLNAYNHVYPEDRSISEVILKAGPIEVECFIAGYRYEPILFGANYRVIGLNLELRLISCKEPVFSKDVPPLDLKDGIEVASTAALAQIIRLSMGATAPFAIPAPSMEQMKADMEKFSKRLDDPVVVKDPPGYTPASHASGIPAFPNKSTPTDIPGYTVPVVENTSAHTPIEPIKTSDTLIDRTRLPASKGHWLGERGDSLWQSELQEVNHITNGKPIPFRDGYPDFTEWSQKTYEFDNLPLDRPKDFALANERLAKDLGLKNKAAAERYLDENNLTWHHHQDRRTLQLLPYDLHSNIPHAGGISKK